VPQRDWVSFQHHNQLPWALTDSGYCADGDLGGLNATLRAGAGLGTGVIIVFEGDPFGGPVAMRLGVGGSWSTVERTRLG
jgi:hypothetical protein